MHLMAGGEDGTPNPDSDRHIGFAVDSREEVDRLCAMAKDDGILVWDIFQGPFPTGYVCSVADPNVNTVEFSCGHLLESEKR